MNRAAGKELWQACRMPGFKICCPSRLRHCSLAPDLASELTPRRCRLRGAGDGPAACLALLLLWTSDVRPMTLPSDGNVTFCQKRKTL